MCWGLFFGSKKWERVARGKVCQKKSCTYLVPSSVRQQKKDSSNLPKSLIILVGRAGIEPTTNGLKVRCSTKLSYRPIFYEKRVN